MTTKHPNVDFPDPGEEHHLLSVSDSASTIHQREDLGPSFSATEPAHVNRENDSSSSFFDLQQYSILRFWSPALTWKQLTIYYSNIYDWIGEMSPAISTAASEGVTVFFVISGFLNLMVSQNISKRSKEKHFSLRSACTFIFRRFMHLGPNLYVVTLLAWLIGCSSGLAQLSQDFCSTCTKYWYGNFLFLDNYFDMWFGNSCFNSTWTVSDEMQMYLVCLPLKVLYKESPFATFIICFFLVVAVQIIRTKLTFMYGTDATVWSSHVYQALYCRVDAYLMGMMLWTIYEHVIQPMKEQIFLPSELQARQEVETNRSTQPNENRNIDKDEDVEALADGEDNEDDVESIGSGDDETKTQEEFSSFTANGPPSPPSMSVADSSFSLGKLFRDYLVVPVQQYFIDKQQRFTRFHTHAPTWMIISIWILWPLMLAFIYLGFQFVFFNSSTESYWWQNTTVFASVDDPVMIESLLRSYGNFASAAGATGLLFFALEGTIVPWAWFCGQYMWFTLGSLTYTGYLLSILTAETFFSIMLYYHDNVQGTWATDTSFIVYMGWYLLIVGINMVFAAIMAFLVERPFLNLSKSIDIWPIAAGKAIL